jgi:hypothetical protein
LGEVQGTSGGGDAAVVENGQHLLDMSNIHRYSLS